MVREIKGRNNPLAGNELQTRSDLQRAVCELFTPLRGFFSPGCARIGLDLTGASYPPRGAELEAFARPLWGIAPLLAGGGTFPDCELYLRGLTNGSNPQHKEYWGSVRDYGQPLVEMASLSFALALAHENLWHPLGSSTQKNLIRWLQTINNVQVYDNNWLLFRMMVNLAFLLLDIPAFSEQMMQEALKRYDTFYLGNGWYSDGNTEQRDYYNTFAMHFFALIYARLAKDYDPQRAQRYRQHAAEFAQRFLHWFAPDGAAIPFGRSLTYRFAQGSLWGALAFADVEALPWSVTKGVALRHLRWWGQQASFHTDGTLSIGYAYPNLNMSEAYNAHGSPYWAMTFFLPLALAEDHPFWITKEEPLPEVTAIQVQEEARMFLCHDTRHNHIFALNGGQYDPWVRHGEAKYGKFAYSAAFGFSVPSAQFGLAQGAYDSMLALSDNGRHFRVREQSLSVELCEQYLYSAWSPWENEVMVETWLIPLLPWHVRVHRLRTTRSLISAEGGFALANTPLRIGGDQEEAEAHAKQHFALAISDQGWSGIYDLASERQGNVVYADPNTNLLYPRTVIPTLMAKHLPGEHLLCCAVCAIPDQEEYTAIWHQRPQVQHVENTIIITYAPYPTISFELDTGKYKNETNSSRQKAVNLEDE